jgi:2-polyprenyl-3-methyl-5-hydroxy-6-metoxy-1,4-benzoquinol methylase
VGLTLQDVRGLAFDPFIARASLSRDASVNYLVHFSREAAGP